MFVAGLLAGSARAQQPPLPVGVVRGVVRDSVTGQPVSGAVAWIADTAGATLMRTLSGDDGRYSLLRYPRSAVLHVVRIGYRPRDIGLAGVADSVVNVSMRSIPSMLPTVATLSRRVCPGDRRGDTRGDEALDVWEQARAALLAGVVSRQTRPPRIRLLSYEKDMEPVRKQVTDVTRNTRDVDVNRSYVAARAPWAFAAYGYMREESNGDRTFYAPDEETLLDPSFAGTHCLRVVTGDRGHAGQVGIGFEPTSDAERDTLVDVRGVLWLQPGSAALSALEFHYTNLEPGTDESKGEIVFRVMPNGAPMVQRWFIRSTLVAFDMPSEGFNAVRRRIPPRPDRRNIRILGFHEVGGDVAEAVWPDGTRWRSDFPRVTGVVLDSSGAPAPRARVWMNATSDTVTTDDNGEFELPPVFPGVYLVQASDSAWAAQGIGRAVPRFVILRQGARADAVLFLRSRPATLTAMCGRQGYTPGTGVLAGRVMGSDGDPVGESRLELWQGPAPVDSVRPPDHTIEAGADGRFVLCGLSLGQPLRLHAWKGRESAEFRLGAWANDITSAQLTLRRP